MADFYQLALGRITRIAMVLGAAGTLVAFTARGWRSGAGFAIGAAISLINFYWWKSLAAALGSSGERPLRGTAIVMVLRYGAVGAALYAIVNVLGITLAGVLAGLFVSVAAILIEILYELLFLRK
jgi:hypothetical protein